MKRKEPGLGEAYGPNRNGEWEYAAYRPDGTTQTAPSATGGCAICHLDAGAQNDFTFRRERMANGASGAAPNATMSHYRFIPGDLTVRKVHGHLVQRRSSPAPDLFAERVLQQRVHD